MKSPEKTNPFIPRVGGGLLTVLQRCPMPLILKDPVGCDESSLRYTEVPATLVKARLCLTGVAT